MKIKDVKVLLGDKFAEVTPDIVAEMFAVMDSEQQAQFFNRVADVASRWRSGEGSFAMQLQYITDEDGLTLAGRRVMQYIGEYSHWGLVPHGDRTFLDSL